MLCHYWTLQTFGGFENVWHRMYERRLWPSQNAVSCNIIERDIKFVELPCGSDILQTLTFQGQGQNFCFWGL